MKPELFKKLIEHCAIPNAHAMVLVGNGNHYLWMKGRLQDIGFDINQQRGVDKFTATLGTAKITVLIPTRDKLLQERRLLGYHQSFIYVE